MEALRSGPASSLKLKAHGRKSDEIDAALLQIYQDNQFHLFWIKDGRPSQRGADILVALQDAGKHGLDPSDYLVGNIVQFWKRTDPAGLVKLDIVLTLGMMRYVADQREGRLQPRQLDPELFATASTVEVDWQTLFQTAFRAPDMEAFLEEQSPPFVHYLLLKKKLAEYRFIAAQGGWPSIPGGETLRPGMADPRLTTLQKRLAISGDLTALNTQSAIYDQRLAEGVKNFQKRHNLSPDGIVGPQTLAA
ncbi:MAG: peptidoglycan-binding protein, partial [Desulforhopalus sp.]